MSSDQILPESVQRVTTLLHVMGYQLSIRMLPDSGKTSAEAAAGIGCSVAEIAKSIVFRRLSDDAAVMVVASGKNRVDEQKVAKIVGPLGKAALIEKHGIVICVATGIGAAQITNVP